MSYYLVCYMFSRAINRMTPARIIIIDSSSVMTARKWFQLFPSYNVIATVGPNIESSRVVQQVLTLSEPFLFRPI